MYLSSPRTNRVRRFRSARLVTELTACLFAFAATSLCQAQSSSSSPRSGSSGGSSSSSYGSGSSGGSSSSSYGSGSSGGSSSSSYGAGSSGGSSSSSYGAGSSGGSSSSSYGGGSGSSDYSMEEEMNVDDYGYDEGSYDQGSYGGSRGRRGGSAQDALAQGFAGSIANVFQSANLASLTDPDAAPPVAAGPVLLNEATVAYSKGNFPLAMNLFFGHIVAEYDEAQSPMQLAKYSRLMRRPAWTVRWGVSIDVRGEATDPQPIGDVAARERPTGRGAGGPRGGGFGDEFGGGYGADMEADYDAAMDEQYGREMEEQYESEMDMEMDREMAEMYGGMGRRRQEQAAAPTPATPGDRLAALEMKMLNEEAEKTFQDNLGIVATLLAEEFQNRYSQGSFGTALTDVSEESGSPETVSSEFVDLLDSTVEPLPLWKPGILFIGQGSANEMTTKAQGAGIDVLIHAQVYLKPLRGGFTQNVCRLRLIHGPSGKSLGVSKEIDSLKFAQESRAKGTGSREYVGEQLEKFWEIIDERTTVSDLPALTAEVARGRIGSLLGTGGGRNLRTLAEVRLFQSQQLLSEDDVLTAFDIVGGEDAMELLFGSEEEKLKVVREWASGRIE